MILVTGSTGLVGSFIVRQLISEGFSVRGLVRETSTFELVEDIKDKVDWFVGDVLDVPSLIEAFQGVSKVVHTAAMVSFQSSEKEQMFKVNVEGTANVVNLAIDFNIEKLLHVSSVAAIGGLGNSVINEGGKWDPKDDYSNYSESKYLAELEVWRGVEEGLIAVMVNPSVVLGPANYSESSSKLFKQAIHKGDYVVDAEINVVDVRDVANASVQLLASTFHSKRFVLSAGKIKLFDFYTLARSQKGLKPPSVILSVKKLKIVSLLLRVLSACFFTKTELTSDAIKSLTKKNTYDGSLITKSLQLEYKDIELTIKWCCEGLVDKKQGTNTAL